jgi:long-chain acyl-CoA synthetase
MLPGAVVILFNQKKVEHQIVYAHRVDRQPIVVTLAYKIVFFSRLKNKITIFAILTLSRMEQLSLTKIYEQSLRNHFEHPALSDYGTDKVWTYGEVAEEIARLHLFFRQCGIAPDDKISLVGKNDSRWCIVYLATITYGAVLVPILQDFSFEDLHHIIQHSDSSLLFVSDSLWENLDEKKLPQVKAVLSLLDYRLLFQRNTSFENRIKQLPAEFSKKYPNGFTKNDIQYEEFPGDKTALINYTSGTTGFTKGVILMGQNIAGNVIFACNTFDLCAGDRTLSLLPLAHAYGAAFDFLYPLAAGYHVTFLGKIPSPKILVKAFGEIRPVLVIAVPLIMEKIYKNMILPVVNKKGMKIALKIPFLNTLLYKQIKKKLSDALGGNFLQAIVGGAPLNSEVEDFFLKIKFPISVGYGMTECAPLISFSVYSDYVPHSSGKVLPCMQVRIDSEDPYNIAGEIQVKGQNVMAGYYKDEKMTRDAFTDDGWLKTGDLGTIDSGNNIFIRGRAKSMILSAGGQNIYPEEIEAKLDQLPYVMESLVVERKNRLVALVYPDLEALAKAGLSENELAAVMAENKDTLNTLVAAYEKIALIELYPEEFEKTPKKSIKRFLYK